MSKILGVYEGLLKTHPKKTNAIMTGTLFGLGDVIAQLGFPQKGSNTKYDFARTARSVIYGSMIFSFVGDRWFKFLSIGLFGQLSNASILLLCLCSTDYWL